MKRTKQAALSLLLLLCLLPPVGRPLPPRPSTWRTSRNFPASPMWCWRTTGQIFRRRSGQQSLLRSTALWTAWAGADRPMPGGSGDHAHRGGAPSARSSPPGWQTAKYDNVDGKYLYNRCHLLGFQLTGENANEENLITGTRYLNVGGMLPLRTWWPTM